MTLEEKAEEYIKEHTFFDEEYGVQSLDVVSKTIFKDGAEFGYNKANEWHYPSKGEYPKNENDILCRISKDEVVVGYYHIKKKRYITIDGQDLYNVSAWKEIVLPELKENE